mmetsp:Transcript_26287/g.75426  ORF Transcript_26287/g.75426 Transcript_26287/m.75426 type:complete len:215 (-) Transcript_26287:1814-2458(-)
MGTATRGAFGLGEHQCGCEPLREHHRRVRPLPLPRARLEPPGDGHTPAGGGRLCLGGPELLLLGQGAYGGLAGAAGEGGAARHAERGERAGDHAAGAAHSGLQQMRPAHCRHPPEVHRLRRLQPLPGLHRAAAALARGAAEGPPARAPGAPLRPGAPAGRALPTGPRGGAGRPGRRRGPGLRLLPGPAAERGFASWQRAPIPVQGGGVSLCTMC